MARSNLKMSGEKFCSECGSPHNLNLVIFFIPIPTASEIRERNQKDSKQSVDSIFSNSNDSLITLEKSELFLMCKNCCQLVQRNRGIKK